MGIQKVRNLIHKDIIYMSSYDNVAGEWVILFSAISSSDNLRLGIRLGSVLTADLTSTFQTPTKFILQWLNNICNITQVTMVHNLQKDSDRLRSATLSYTE